MRNVFFDKWKKGSFSYGDDTMAAPETEDIYLSEK